MKITEKQAWTLLSMLYGMNAATDRHLPDPEAPGTKKIRNPDRDILTKWGLCEAIMHLEGAAHITPAIAERMEDKIRDYAHTKGIGIRFEYIWTNDQQGDLQRMRWAAKQAKVLNA